MRTPQNNAIYQTRHHVDLGLTITTLRPSDGKRSTDQHTDLRTGKLMLR